MATAKDKPVDRVVEMAKGPLLAVLGAGEAASEALTDAIGKARAGADQAGERTEQAQERVRGTLTDLRARLAELPAELNHVRTMEPAERRRIVETYRENLSKTYESLVNRGETAYGELRNQPKVGKAIDSMEAGVDTAHARLDSLVDDVRTVVDDLLARFSGEAATGSKVSGEAATGSNVSGEGATGSKAGQVVDERSDDTSGEAGSGTERKAGGKTSTSGHKSSTSKSTQSPKSSNS